VVVLVDPGGDPGPGCCLGGELLHRAELELQGRVPGFDDRVVQRGPGSAHRLAGAQPLAGRAEGARGVFAAAVGVHDDAGDLAAAHRHRYGQRAVGQSGVVVLAEREAEYPPGGHVQDRGQVELALPGLDLGAIAVPFLVDLLRGEVPLDSAIVSIGVVKNEHIGQAFGAIRKAGTVVVVGVSNEREGAPVPGFNAITVAMFQKRIQGSLYGMGSPRDAMPNLLNLYAAGRLKLDELITRRYALDDVNQAYADMRSGVNIRGAVDFIPAG